MKFLRSLIFLLCLPALLLRQTPAFSQEQCTFYNDKGHEIFIPHDKNGLIDPFGYFEIKNIFTHMDGYVNHYFDFVDLICDEEFLETLSEEEFDRAVDFAVWVVRYSVPKSRPDIKEQYERDIEDLYRILEEDDEEEEEFYFSSNQNQILPIQLAVCIQKPKILLCKKKKKKGGLWNQIKRKSKHFGHWCKKHKKPVIIGAVVVGTVTAVVLTGGVGGGAAAAVGGAFVESMNDPPPRHINKPGNVHFREDPTPVSNAQDIVRNEPSISIPPPHDKPILNLQTSNDRLISSRNEEVKAKINERTEPLKEEVAFYPTEDIPHEDKPFWGEFKEDVKGTASYLLHQALDDVADLGFKHVIDEEVLDAGHQMLDKTFETDFASNYSELGKEEIALLNEKLGFTVSIGELPPPAVFGGAIVKAAKTATAIGTAVVAQEAVVVYRSFNEVTGEVNYVGITNNFERRAGEHLRVKGIQIEEIDNMPPLSRSDARAVEQTLFELHKLKKNGGTLINKINSIAKANPKYEDAIRRGGEILIEIGYSD